MDSKLTCIDLFCGAGGFSYGFLQSGINVVLGIDNDEAAIKSFNASHNGVGMVGDLREISTQDIIQKAGTDKIDIIIGGPPCQGLSLSGLRKSNDPRNQLYKSYVRVVKDLLPQIVVIENVPGLVSLFKGKVRDSILREFSSLGYKMNYEILMASHFGVPQHRKRVFFVGTKRDEFIFPQPTHFEYPSIFPNTQINVTCEEALSDLPLLNNEDLGDEFQEYPTDSNNNYQKMMRLNSEGIYNHIAANHSDRVRDIISLVPPGKNYKSLPEEFRNTRKFNVAWTRFPDKQPAPTIDTGHRHHFHYKANRVPTVRECARLQSFPDTFIFYGNKTQQFRQVGNAVPPLLAKSLGDSLKEQL